MIMNKVKMCVFDMDGILLDSETVYLINAKRCNEKYGFDISVEVLNSTMGSSEKDCQRIFLEHLGQDFPYDDFINKLVDLQTEYIKQNPYFSLHLLALIR